MSKLIGLVVLLIINGCSTFNTSQIQKDKLDATGKSTERTTSTEVTVRTLFSAKSTLATSTATQTDKSQGAKLGGLSQEGGVTPELINAIAAGLAAGLKAGVELGEK